MVDETVEENTAAESDDFRIPETWTELCENEPLFSLLPPLAPAERLSFKQAAQLRKLSSMAGFTLNADLNGDHRLRIPSKPWQYGRLVCLGFIGRVWRLILQYPRPVQAVRHCHQPRREAFGASGIQPRAGYVQTIETLEVGSQFDRVDADLRFEAIDFPSWSV